MCRIAAVVFIALFAGGALAQSPKPDASALNRQGLAARKGGDAVKATALYREAIGADPRYAPARYNLACELARARDADGAMAQLDALLAMGTPDARRFAAVARHDSDFAPISKDPRFLRLQRSFDLDLKRPILAQLCADPARLVDVVDPKLGLITWRDVQDVASDGPGVTQARTLTGGRARAAAAKLFEDGELCEAGKVASDEDGCSGVADKVLVAPRDAGLVCFERQGCMEWSTNDEVCFGRTKTGRWALVFVSQTDSGVLVGDPSFMRGVSAREKTQKAAAIELLKR